MRRIENEKSTVVKMISIYCKSRHKTVEGLCPECSELAEYAMKRLSMCPFQDSKPVCSKCRIHCYKPEMREKIRQVMRFSGPRMIFYDPIAAIRHLSLEFNPRRHLL